MVVEHPINPYTTMKGLRKAQRSIVTCDLCGNQVNKRKDDVRGEYICETCGAVLGRVMMHGRREVLFDD